MRNETLSLTHSLLEGLTDGTFKKLTPDRGGVVSSAEWERDLKGELNEQYRPDWVDGTDYADRYTSL